MFYGIGTRYARTSELSGKLSAIQNSEFSTKIEPRKILIKLYFVTERGYIRIVLLIYNIRLSRNKWLIKNTLASLSRASVNILYNINACYTVVTLDKPT